MKDTQIDVTVTDVTGSTDTYQAPSDLADRLPDILADRFAVLTFIGTVITTHIPVGNIARAVVGQPYIPKPRTVQLYQPAGGGDPLRPVLYLRRADEDEGIVYAFNPEAIIEEERDFGLLAYYWCSNGEITTRTEVLAEDVRHLEHIATYLYSPASDRGNVKVEVGADRLPIASCWYHAFIGDSLIAQACENASRPEPAVTG